MNNTKQVTTRICDNCKKEVSDGGELRIGGSVFSGWFEVKRICGSTSLENLRAQKEFDFCSPDCLKYFAESHLGPA